MLLASKNELLFQMIPALVIEGVVLHATKGTPAADLEVAAFDATPYPIVPRWKAQTGADVLRSRQWALVRAGSCLHSSIAVLQRSRHLHHEDAVPQTIFMVTDSAPQIRHRKRSLKAPTRSFISSLSLGHLRILG